MADDVREFSKDNPPNPNEIVAYRAREVVYATFVPGKSKVGGKNHDGPGFVIVGNALENKDSSVKFMDADEFQDKYAVANAADTQHRPMGPHFDADEASEQQADGYQFNPLKEGDVRAGQQLQNPSSA